LEGQKSRSLNDEPLEGLVSNQTEPSILMPSGTGMARKKEEVKGES